jgi:hypothetical protein
MTRIYQKIRRYTVAEKDFYSIEEVGIMSHRNRGTVYNRIKLLNIKTRKFPMDRKTYVSAEDALKIKTVIEKPWMANELGATGGGDQEDGVEPAA